MYQKHKTIFILLVIAIQIAAGVAAWLIDGPPRLGTAILYVILCALILWLIFAEDTGGDGWGSQ